VGNKSNCQAWRSQKPEYKQTKRERKPNKNAQYYYKGNKWNAETENKRRDYRFFFYYSYIYSYVDTFLGQPVPPAPPRL
jgi:uncharacterized membrane protein YcgQ (UPF0703/DUF1980 family)